MARDQPAINHYDILGVAPTATTEEVKAAYQDWMAQYQPDRNSSTHSNAVAALLNEAWDILGNPERRRLYDTAMGFRWRVDALNVLGLKDGFSADELNQAWKVAARKNHPDMGGSNEAMSQVNNAYTMLLHHAGEQATQVSRETQQADWDAKLKGMQQVVKDLLIERLSPQAFSDHFAAVFGEPFVLTSMSKVTERGQALLYIGQWGNQSETIVLEMNLHVDVLPLMETRVRVLSRPDSFLSMSITTEMLVNRKKVPLSQRLWRMRGDRTVLSDPEVLFPAATLTAQIGRNVSRQFSKQNVLLTFKKELYARIEHKGSEVWVYLPVGLYSVVLNRMTKTGLGAWKVDGIYDKYRRLDITIARAVFPEDEPTLRWLWEELKGLQADDVSLDDIALRLNQLVQDYTARRAAS